MSKSIITQDGNIVNYGNLVAVYIEDDLDDDENVLGYNLIGLTGLQRKLTLSFSEAIPMQKMHSRQDMDLSAGSRVKHSVPSRCRKQTKEVKTDAFRF